MNETFEGRQGEGAGMGGVFGAEQAVQRMPEEEFLAAMLAGRDVSDLVDPDEAREAEEQRIAAMDEVQREAYFEHEALQTVFDDIRLRSRGGELTTPDYWESVDLVPEHMEAGAFTALVFDTIIDAQAKAQERREAAEAAAKEASFADAAAVEASGAEARQGADAPAPADPDADVSGEPAVQPVASATPEAAAGGSDEAAGNHGLAAEASEEAWELDDIAVLEGSSVYLYSTDEMSESFARWAFLAAENDDVATLVENARHESKVYPRPMKAKSLTNRPVYMTAERIAAAFEAVQESGLYPDVKTCSASNGDVYFYSTDYLSDAQAKALAEWESVERRANM